MCTVHCADGHARCLAVQPGYKAELPALLDSVFFCDSLIFFWVPYRYFDSAIRGSSHQKRFAWFGGLRGQTHAKLVLHLGLQVQLTEFWNAMWNVKKGPGAPIPIEGLMIRHREMSKTQTANSSNFQVLLAQSTSNYFQRGGV